MYQSEVGRTLRGMNQTMGRVLTTTGSVAAIAAVVGGVWFATSAHATPAAGDTPVVVITDTPIPTDGPLPSATPVDTPTPTDTPTVAPAPAPTQEAPVSTPAPQPAPVQQAPAPQPADPGTITVQSGSGPVVLPAPTPAHRG